MAGKPGWPVRSRAGEFSAGHTLAAAAIALTALAIAARADDVRFEAAVGGGVRAATVAELRIDEVPYVSLVRVLEQLGGGQTLLASRMRADFANMTAWIQYDDTRVNAMSMFSLRWKAIKQGDDVLIARDDVPLFFDSAFRTQVSIANPANAPESIRITPDGEREVTMPVAESLGRTAMTIPRLEPVPEADNPIGVLVIDAGHGGYDAGAELPPALQEKNVTLGIALKIKALVERNTKIRVIATRESDLDIGIKQRALLAANAGGDFVVTIHFGASFSPATKGPALFFTPGKAEVMARAIATKLGASAASPVRGVYEAPLRLPFLANAQGLLIEVGCITNAQDALVLPTPEFADAIAADIAAGISEYLASQSASPPA